MQLVVIFKGTTHDHIQCERDKTIRLHPFLEIELIEIEGVLQMLIVQTSRCLNSKNIGTNLFYTQQIYFTLCMHLQYLYGIPLLQ